MSAGWTSFLATSSSPRRCREAAPSHASTDAFANTFSDA